MANQNVQMEIHVVNCPQEDMVVVHCLKPHVVLMEFIVAQTDTVVTEVGLKLATFYTPLKVDLIII